jgi:hypothetical protein
MFQPFFSQHFSAKHIGGMLHHACVLEGNGALLKVDACRLLAALAIDCPTMRLKIFFVKYKLEMASMPCTPFRSKSLTMIL